MTDSRRPADKGSMLLALRGMGLHNATMTTAMPRKTRRRRSREERIAELDSRIASLVDKSPKALAAVDARARDPRDRAIFGLAAREPPEAS